MKSKKVISLSLLLPLTAGVFFGALSAHFNKNVAITYAEGYPHGDGATYYNGISDSLEGDNLTKALRSLNNSKKKTEGGYSALLTGKMWAKYTDYDPTSSVKYDSNGMPYSTTILSFYSGNKAYNGNGMNREHVWPNSKGGNLVEDDTHMARPTLTSENSSRGNSFYVEGMTSQSSGWDPGAESWGDATYRGDSARIIFYCAMARSELTLVDRNYDSSANKTMGKLSDLLKWNLQYPVTQRERNRNEAVEYIQGNRNPFIDHPEYACKIWGNYNSTTKYICGLNNIAISTSTLSMKEGNVASIYATSKASSITWTNSANNVISLNKVSTTSGESVSITALQAGRSVITATAVVDGTSYSQTCEVTVKADRKLTSISLSGDYPTVFNQGSPFSKTGLVVTANYDNGDSEPVTDYLISQPNMNQLGTQNVYISYEDEGITVSVYYTITIVVPVVHVESIELNVENLKITVGQTRQLEALIYPTNATDKEVTWSTSNSDIAKVSQVGLVTAKAVGTATITATTTDGGLTATCTVTVKEAVQPSGGCGGSVATTSIVLSTLSVLGVGLLLIKRKFSK